MSSPWMRVNLRRSSVRKLRSGLKPHAMRGFPLSNPRRARCVMTRPAARPPIDTIRHRIRGHRYRPIAADDGALTHAVLVPLSQLGRELHVILTKRTTRVTMQQGHISFPGGGRERRDRDLLGTAQRESFAQI